MGEKVQPVEELWELPEPTKILARQQKDGAWKYPAAKLQIRSQNEYNQLETYRNVGILVEKYGFTDENQAIQNAAEFLFKFQTEEGNFRGTFGNQYATHYTAAIIEILTKAGYDRDARIEAGFHWLHSVRQDDGGWTIPARTVQGRDSLTLMEAIKRQEPINPDRSKPFSHLITGVVLRAFAAHPKHRTDAEAKHAGELLKSRFFQPDKYRDRKAPSFWTSFSYPFWFTDLLSSLDSLSQLNFTRNDPDVQRALDWFIARQETNGLWKLKMLKTKDKALSLWLCLAISRVFKRFH
jgi:hypothetical protein